MATRSVVLDTETTGMPVTDGHRIIEIGCVELIGRRLTGRHFHVYLQPDRESDEGAIGVHGITNEFLVGTARQMNSHLTARAYGRIRETTHFWEDTNNTARVDYNPPASVNGVDVPRTPYIANLTEQRTQIGNGTPNGSTYVIAELDGAYTKYWEGTVELEWHSTKGMANLSYTRSHYYGNFDQDNSTTSTANDAAIFMGSSNIGDSAGRQLWDNKDGDLHGDRPNLLKISGVRYLHWKASAGFFFLYQSGSPWESTNYELYRPLTGTNTSDTNRYGEPAGSRRTDSHYQLDFNYSQDVKITERLKFQVVGNVFNVFNKQTPYNFQPSVHSSLYAQPASFYDPRRLELDLRLRF